MISKTCLLAIASALCACSASAREMEEEPETGHGPLFPPVVSPAVVSPAVVPPAVVPPSCKDGQIGRCESREVYRAALEEAVVEAQAELETAQGAEEELAAQVKITEVQVQKVEVISQDLEVIRQELKKKKARGEGPWSKVGKGR